MKAIILAAGIGSRLALEDIPKPMYKIQGVPILEHNILLLKKHNIKDICINLYYKGKVIKKYFGDGSKWNVKITYSEEKELLGTSGAIKNIEWFWTGDPFFVLYGDNYTDIDLNEMMSLHKAGKPIGTIAVFDPQKVANSQIAGGFVKTDKNNNIISFIEGNKTNERGYVNAGVYVLEPGILDMIPPGKSSDFGKDIFPKVIESRHILKAYLTKSFVIAIDTKEALEHTEKITRRQ